MRCHFLSEGWDCGKPSKERCECLSAGESCACIGHSHNEQPSERVLLMNGKWERVEDFDERMGKIA